MTNESDKVESQLTFNQDTLPNKTVSIPMANEEDRKEGWTLDYDFIQQLAEKARQYGGYTPGLEETESVLLALFDIEWTAEGKVPDDPDA